MSKILLKIEAGLTWLQHEIGEAIAVAWPYVKRTAAVAYEGLRRAFSALCRWLKRLEERAIEVYGPIEESVKGDVSKDEAKKIFHKTAIGFVTGGVVSLRDILYNPDNWATFFSPLLFASVIGLLAYLHHKGDGAAPAQPPSQ